LTIFSRRQLLALVAAGATRTLAEPASTLISVSDFGARGDGQTKETKAFQDALDEAHRRGGGTVYVRAGQYVCGTVHLRSKVSLWLDNGATLRMSQDRADFAQDNLGYDPHADRSTANFRSALLSGDSVENVAIWGEGQIDCERMKSGGPKPIALRQVKHVDIRGITIRRAPNYNISLLGCEYVRIDGVTIENGFSDGIDPDCSRFVSIANCFVESVDDAICLKTSGALGERRTTENVTVTNCVLRTASIHFKCGTESCGDFRNITVANCAFQGGMGKRHGNPGIALYTTDEGALEGVTIDNITMADVGLPIAVVRGDRDRCRYGGKAGLLSSIRISNVVARNAKLASVIAGIPNAPVQQIHFRSISVDVVPGESGPTDLGLIPEKPTQYPDPTMFGPLPAYGFFLRHVDGVSLTDIRLTAGAGEQRGGVAADDVANLRIAEYEASDGEGSPSLWGNNLRDATLQMTNRCRFSGGRTQRVKLLGGAPAEQKRNVLLDKDVPDSAVTFH
jgi:polygalacturonase